MQIKFWGARGSVPVSGKEFLKYGGDTTCVEVRSSRNDLIIVDAGTGIRHLGKMLVKKDDLKFTMLFTHSHWDHIIGFPFFAPIYNKKTEITVFACASGKEDARDIVAKTMRPPGFPIKFEEISASFRFKNFCGLEARVGGLKISSIPLSHPNNGYGYKFEENGRTFVFLTDNELGFSHEKAARFNEYIEFCRGADLLVHDAEYKNEEYPRKISWGHSTVKDAVNLALKSGVKTLGLFHHNQDRTDKEIDSMTRRAEKLKGDSNLKVFAVYQNQEIRFPKLAPTI